MHKQIPDSYDHSNGTVETLNDLTNNKYNEWIDLIKDEFLNSIAEWFLSDDWIEYYETPHYIFTHAFIPLNVRNAIHMYYAQPYDLSFKENWRDSTPKEFQNATWGCPWKLARDGLNKTGKTIVCGHWHTSDFFNNLKHLKIRYNWFSDNPLFISKKYKLIGLDACTAATHKINVLVLNEDEL